LVYRRKRKKARHNMADGKPDTRERMVGTAARLLATQGYHATGVAQVIEQSESPRGSLYFHFPEGKEQIAVEAIRQLGRQLGDVLRAKLEKKADVRSGLGSLLRMFARQLETTSFQLGCPVATVALEAASAAPGLRRACDDVFASWEGYLAERLRQESPRRAQPERLARSLLAILEGALLLSKTRASTEPLRDAELSLDALLGREGSAVDRG
jgi:TetR/AcrR family transcriptional regulator, lmrAB and yxaGH operons repressor